MGNGRTVILVKLEERMRKIMSMSAAVVLGCLCIALAADQVKNKNVLGNGSFEEMKEGKPADWVLGQGATVKDEGSKHFLRTSAVGADATVSATQKVTIEAGWSKLTLKAKMRGKQIKPGEQAWNEPRITLFFANEAGEHVGDWPEAVRLREDSADWKEMSVTVDVPAGAKTVEVRAGLIQCQGEVDFDDISLEPK
jgi:hypothetical protein